LKNKILLAEDEEHLRFLYEEELGEEGYQVTSARNGKEALQKLEDTRPDLVILDIAMPVMNGLEALARIRERRDGKIPVILHTSYERYRQDPVGRSADAYVLKSIDMDELKEKIKELIQS